ncbi:MAG: hypothetical protein JJU16_01615 [Alkalibacterium sp.]|nr:hypothetical protein [Alkalibacterium sp.]
MNKRLKEGHYLPLSLLSAVSVYLFSMIFQEMAYWGQGLLWFWVGVLITYLVWFLGLVFLIMAIRKIKMNTVYLIGYAISGCLLMTGFMWVSFIIIMGLG